MRENGAFRLIGALRSLTFAGNRRPIDPVTGGDTRDTE